MGRPRATERPRKSARRWHIPPPLVHGSDPLEGGAVLEEIPGAAGLLLWQALRDVLLWAETPPAEREALFAHAANDTRRGVLARAALPPACEPPLRTLGSLLGRPSSADPSDIAAACTRISRWAEENGAIATALAFAQDAALVAGESAGAALAVARLAVRRADHARAEVWFRRALGMARRARDWRIYTQAFAGMGSLYRSRGNLRGAQRFHLRALRGARRGGLRAEQAAALHDLFAVAVETGSGEDAGRLAREAYEAYGSHSPRLPVLAHDVAYYWMEEGHFARALRVFRAVLPRIERPVERLWVEADLARAAAGVGEVALARESAARVLHRCERRDLAPGAPKALLEVGRALFQLGDLDAAESAAEAAAKGAADRREGRTGLMAESLLDAVRRARTASKPALPPPAPDPGAERLAEEMIRSLDGLERGSSRSGPAARPSARTLHDVRAHE